MIINTSNYYKWYFIPKIKFNIIKYTKNRETMLLSHDRKKFLRMLKIHSVQHIDFHLKALNWYKQKWNIYYSMAQYKNGIPNQKFNLAARDNSQWKKDHWKQMVSYDFLIDIDATTHDEIIDAKLSALNIIRRLEKHKILYDVRFSGMGFHIVVPYDHFKSDNYSFDPKHERSIYSYYSLMARKLNIEISEMVDYKINDSRRVCKVPYSLAIYENIIYVCCPLTIKMLKEFKLENYTPENVIKWLQ